ncbi:MAG: hypothetical protein PWQ06_2726 [Anaerophaga sp.]|nr:hypothetical protein [Eubacteriaceae bacterium]MDN5292487.1 hypothetical protein [Anaerophaga sp.]
MYEPLSYYFYKDKTKYKEKVDERLNNELTIKLNFMIGRNEAFYLPIRELKDSIINIYRADKRISKIEASLPTKALQQFSKRCLIDEIVLTNKIEGVHSTRKEIGKVLQELENKSKVPQRFKGLVTKYNMLSEDSDIPLSTCQDIRDLYDELVLPEVKNTDKNNIPDGSVFRKDSVCVYSETQKSIHEGLYPEEKICAAMEKALAVLNNKDVEQIPKIAAFHYFFGYIHPFYDGNGRISRFISSYLLSKELEPILAFRISYTIHENIKEYYKAFEICNNPQNMGDITPFLLMFVKVIEKSMDQLETSLKKRTERLKYYSTVIVEFLHETCQQQIKDKFIDMSYVLVQVSLFSEIGVSKTELTNILNLSPATVIKYLKIFRDKELLIEEKDGREKLYRVDTDKLDSISLKVEDSDVEI